MRRALLPFALLVAAGAGPVASADLLTARLDPLAATVGDRVRAEIELVLEEGSLAAPPELELDERWGEAEVLTRTGRPVPAEGEPTGWRWTLELAAFRPGPMELPPLTTVVPGPEPRTIAMEAPLTLEIRSVLPAEGAVEPRPPTPPQAWPGISPWWWAGGAGALLALAALFLWWRRRRGPLAVAARAGRSPLDALRAELDAVLALEDSEIAHTRLSLAVRRYLEGRLAFPAAEHTTREIRRDLRTTALPVPLQRDLLEVLAQCDEVKFARREDSLEAARDRAHRAGELATGIEDALRPREPVEEAA